MGVHGKEAVITADEGCCPLPRVMPVTFCSVDKKGYKEEGGWSSTRWKVKVGGKQRGIGVE